MQPFNGYVIVGYYTSWSIYSRKYPVWQIDPQSITHLNYAFANLREDGEVILGDPWADVEQVNTAHGDSWSDPPGSLHGNFHQLWRLKQRNRKLKVGLSVGGWTWSKHFSRVAATEAGRQRFASTAVQLMIDLGLDYLDLDWEYPGGGGLPDNSQDPADPQNLVKLLAAIRAEYGKHDLSLQLTAAISANLSHYDLPGMAQHLDYFLLMGYDFAGGWSTVCDHQANLYGRDESVLSVDQAVRGLLQHVHPRQIIMGVPFYGRTFANTAGLATAFKGPGPGSWEAGILDYQAIPPLGCTPRWESASNATFCYNPSTKLLVSYDDPTSMAFKLQYLRKMGLGGIMFWDLSGDRPLSDGRSLLRTINAWIGGPWKDQTLNNLCYRSKYPNLVCPKYEAEMAAERALQLSTSTVSASSTSTTCDTITPSVPTPPTTAEPLTSPITTSDHTILHASTPYSTVSTINFTTSIAPSTPSPSGTSLSTTGTNL